MGALIVAICEKHPCLHVGVTSVLSQRPSSAKPPCFLFSVRILLPEQESHVTLLQLQKRKIMANGGGRGGGNPLQ